MTTKKQKDADEASTVTTVNVSQLIPDDKNFNRGTQFGQHLLEESLRRFGAGRSILIDKNNRVVAGNKTLENAGAIGLEDVIVVETDGSKLVAVKRTDIDIDTAKGRELALADNASGRANLDFDTQLIADVAAEMNFDPSAWGINCDAIKLDEEGEEAGGAQSAGFKIEVTCQSEIHQQAIKQELEERGYICRVIN